jgi:ATP-binding cassette subfamily C (CFTR/MRP) protein 1
LKDRTRILVTHAVDFLPQADHIILMDEGRIVSQGTFKEMEEIKEF